MLFRKSVGTVLIKVYVLAFVDVVWQPFIENGKNENHSS